MTITPELLVAREVHYCASHIVSILAQGYGERLPEQLSEAAEQAFELCSPILDYEEAATHDGWSRRDDGMFVNQTHMIEGDDGSTDFDPHGYGDWATLCNDQEIEPYEREIYEHWIVSDWLAEKLDALGEKTDKDFAGMTIWARTTTGQGIASDSVIERICADLNAGA